MRYAKKFKHKCTKCSTSSNDIKKHSKVYKKAMRHVLIQENMANIWSNSDYTVSCKWLLEYLLRSIENPFTEELKFLSMLL